MTASEWSELSISGTLVGFIAASVTRNYFADRDVAVTRDAQGGVTAVPNPCR